MKTIIAEKYSYAKNIRSALEMKGERFTSHMEKANGYLESENYIITWCFGHLFGLQDMDSYIGDGQKRRWSLDDLPFFPEKFEFVLKDDPGVRKQFACIRKCIGRSDEVISAGDADREGQLIVDLVLAKAGNRKPVSRLWVNDQTPATIAKGLDEMKPDSFYANIRNEGLARTYIDWLYGINLTRYATVKAGGGILLRVGRVIVPVVQEIVARDRAIESFVPEDYMTCVSETECMGVPLKLKSEHTFAMDDAGADELCRRYNESGGDVTEVTQKETAVQPPHLFSQGSLQSHMGKRMDPKTVLACAQKLYEAGLISYPRTGTEYLFPTEKEKVKGILKSYPDCAFRDSSAIFNASKNADKSHSAIIPTGKKPSGLTADQQAVYDAIDTRFRAVFWAQERRVSRTTMTIRVSDEDFRLTGDVLISEGWGAIETARLNSRQIPPLSEGDHIDTDFRPVKATTSPPKHYTIKALNAFMENPYAKEEKTDVQLGTDATRAGIIDNAIRSGYISLRKDTYYAEEKGRFLVDAIDRMQFGIDKNQSLRLAEILVSIRDDGKSVRDALTATEGEIRRIMESSQGVNVSGMYSGERKADAIVGRCPACGGAVKEEKTDRFHFFVCENHRKDDASSCPFIVSADFRRFSDRIPLTASKMKTLLGGGLVSAQLTSKAGKKYRANVKLVMNGRYVNLQPVFDEQPGTSGGQDKAFCRCPKCGKSIHETPVGWSCEDREGCGCIIFRNDRFFAARGGKMTPATAKRLFTDGHAVVSFTSKTGKVYSMDVAADFSGKYVQYKAEFVNKR